MSPRYQDVQTSSEVAETVAVLCSPFNEPNHDRRCRREHLRLRYAYRQPDFELADGRVLRGDHYWHVMSEGPSRHSTLSMRGLREWGLL